MSSASNKSLNLRSRLENLNVNRTNFFRKKKTALKGPDNLSLMSTKRPLTNNLRQSSEESNSKSTKFKSKKKRNLISRSLGLINSSRIRSTNSAKKCNSNTKKRRECLKNKSKRNCTKSKTALKTSILQQVISNVLRMKLTTSSLSRIRSSPRLIPSSKNKKRKPIEIGYSKEKSMSSTFSCRPIGLLDLYQVKPRLIHAYKS